MRTYSKNIKREIRALAGILYERELNLHLSDLSIHFDHWKKGNLSPFELSGKIHEFHQKPARELFNLYTTNSTLDMAVSRGLANGLLKESEVSAELRDALHNKIKFYREDL